MTVSMSCNVALCQAEQGRICGSSVPQQHVACCWNSNWGVRLASDRSRDSADGTVGGTAHHTANISGRSSELQTTKYIIFCCITSCHSWGSNLTSVDRSKYHMHVPDQVSAKWPRYRHFGCMIHTIPLLSSTAKGDMAAHSPTSAASLPEALTAQILQHVPQQQRLQQCALVCKAWASAAALATIHIQQKLKPGQATSAFVSWLQKHAGQLESLVLSCSDYNTQPQLCLCNLAKLQRLQLQGFELLLPGQEEGSDACAGVGTNCPAPLLPSLQHLELSSVHLASSSSLVQLAAGAQGLTRFRTRGVTIGQAELCSGASHVNDSQQPAVQQMAAAIAGLLQQLPRLAVLELPGWPISDAAMQQLGGMQGLQEVSLEHVDHMPMCKLQHLPSSVTQLHLRGNIFQIEAFNSPSMPPQLQQLAGLLRLELHFCAVPPTVLGAFTRLQVLKLQACTLLPAPEDDADFETEGTAALLDALAGMTCLQDLCLALPGVDTVSTAPQRFAALTASTQLTRLEISPLNCTPLAKGAAQYMFPAGRQLPLLQELTIMPEGAESGWPLTEWCINGADIHGIATCCAGLRVLDLGQSVRPGADLSGLLELPESLQSLFAEGAAFGDSAAPVLAQLTQLDYLCLSYTPGFTDAGLEQFTDLNLGRLYVYDSGLSDAVSQGEGGMIDLKWTPDKGSVQQQLEAMCDLSAVCAPARLRKQREANEQLESDIELEV